MGSLWGHFAQVDAVCNLTRLRWKNIKPCMLFVIINWNKIFFPHGYVIKSNWSWIAGRSTKYSYERLILIPENDKRLVAVHIFFIFTYRKLDFVIKQNTPSITGLLCVRFYRVRLATNCYIPPCTLTLRKPNETECTILNNTPTLHRSQHLNPNILNSEVHTKLPIVPLFIAHSFKVYNNL